jgi:hypothetical protein
LKALQKYWICLNDDFRWIKMIITTKLLLFWW